jgi:hypothetical protein
MFTALARRFVRLGAGRFGTGDQFDHISKPLTIHSGQTYNDMVDLARFAIVPHHPHMLDRFSLTLFEGSTKVPTPTSSCRLVAHCVNHRSHYVGVKR